MRKTYYVYKNVVEKMTAMRSSTRELLGGEHPTGSKGFSVFYPDVRFHEGATSYYSEFLDRLFDTTVFEDTPPHMADYFVVPISVSIPRRFRETTEMIDRCVRAMASQLEFFKGREKRHVFFMPGDSGISNKVFEKSIVFQCSCHRKSRTAPLHYGSPISGKSRVSILDATLDLSFMGCYSHPVRAELEGRMPQYNSEGVRSRFVKGCWSNLEVWTPRPTEEMERAACELMDQSRFVLCPRGAGLNSIRFFETMSFGRLPVLIADDTKIPFPGTVDYGEFLVRVPERDVKNLTRYLKNFTNTHDLEIASARARSAWSGYFSEESFRNFLDASLDDVKKRERIF